MHGLDPFGKSMFLAIQQASDAIERTDRKTPISQEEFRTLAIA